MRFSSRNKQVLATFIRFVVTENIMCFELNHFGHELIVKYILEWNLGQFLTHYKLKVSVLFANNFDIERDGLLREHVNS